MLWGSRQSSDTCSAQLCRPLRGNGGSEAQGKAGPGGGPVPDSAGHSDAPNHDSSVSTCPVSSTKPTGPGQSCTLDKDLYFFFLTNYRTFEVPIVSKRLDFVSQSVAVSSRCPRTEHPNICLSQGCSVTGSVPHWMGEAGVMATQAIPHGRASFYLPATQRAVGVEGIFCIFAVFYLFL